VILKRQFCRVLEKLGNVGIARLDVLVAWLQVGLKLVSFKVKLQVMVKY
jgi:hypothetical protein